MVSSKVGRDVLFEGILTVCVLLGAVLILICKTFELPEANLLFCFGRIQSLQNNDLKRNFTWDYPGGPVVKNTSSNAGDVGSIHGWGTKIPHAEGQLRPSTLKPVPCNN